MSPEHKHISRFELLMDAGFGAQKAGDILIRAFARSGKYVYIEPMIPAEISPPPRTRPALSGVIIRVADFDITNIGNDTDIILASQEIVLDRRLDDGETNPNCHIMLDMGQRASNEDSYEKVLKRVTKLHYKLHLIETTPEAQALIKELSGRGQNMYYLGMLAAIYNMPEQTLLDEITRVFGKRLKPEILEKNFTLFHHGFAYSKAHIPLSVEVTGCSKKKEPPQLVSFFPKRPGLLRIVLILIYQTQVKIAIPFRERLILKVNRF